MTTVFPHPSTLSTGSATPELARLLHPVPPEDFLRTHWEQRHLRVHREEPDYFSGLLTLDGIDQVLSLAGLDLDNIRVVVQGKETPVAELAGGRGRNSRANSLEALYQRYRDGSTITVNALEDRNETLQRVAVALGRELGARAQMNVYLTPPHAQGFAAHYDTHDVFIAQVYGSKVWRLAGAPYPLPLASRPHDKSAPTPEPVEEFELRAGDLLYLPRGTLHSGAANRTASLHVTIGLHPVLWVDEIRNALGRLAHDDVRFRRSLPVGFARDGSCSPGVRGYSVRTPESRSPCCAS